MATITDFYVANNLRAVPGTDKTIHVSSAQRRTDPDLTRFTRTSIGNREPVKGKYLSIKIPIGIDFEIKLPIKITLIPYQTYFRTESDGSKVLVAIYHVLIDPEKPQPIGDIEIVEPEQDVPVVED